MFTRNIVSMSVASILLASSVAATANTQEDNNDSVSSWGKWAQNYSTAAGGELNTGALVFASLGQSEIGRNSQNEAGLDDRLVGMCEAGQACAFSSFYAHNPVGDEADQFSTGTTGIKKMDNRNGGQVFIFDKDGSELYRHSKSDNSGQEYYSDIDRTMDLDGAYDDTFADLDGAEGVGDGVWFETAGDYWDFGGGAWGVDGSEGGSVWPLNGIGGFYVAGVASSLTAVESLVGRVDLNYQGTSYNGTSVSIDLNMGARTWSAQFVAKDYVSDGRFKNTSFNVNNGSIQGVNLTATGGQLSAGVTGEVQAAFFGDTANQIGGVVDIQKQGMGYTDSFVASIGDASPMVPK